MKYIIQGKGEIQVNQNDFISEGGEGKIYGVGDQILKIYTDLKKMIPYAKIQELQSLSRPNILFPKDIILLKNQVVGFTMDYIKQTVALCKLFTNDFRNKNNIEPHTILKLVENMQETIVFIHDKGCLIVDGNEFNYLVDTKTYTIPYFIDVNSYQTKSFPATAIMPSVRDWHTKGFNKNTDWFSFAIVSFQLFVGIHPFKGKHPDFKPGQLEERMRKNISVLNPQVSIPATARDFSHIPADFMEWYIKLFEKGERIPPPKVAGFLKVIQVKVDLIISSNNFEIKLEKEYDNEIVKFKSYFTYKCVTTKKDIAINDAKYRISKDVGVIFTQMLNPIFVKIEDDLLKMYDVKNKQVVNLTTAATEFMVVNNTLYVRFEDSFTEMSVWEGNGKILTTPATTWKIMPKASTVLDGVVYQNILGKAYLSIPIPENHSMVVIPIPEMDGYRIIDGKHENRICMLTGHKGSVYSKIILRFDETYSKYDIRIIDNIEYSNINFTTLENGVCVSINDDDSLEVFAHHLTNNRVIGYKDPSINSSMTLCKDGARVMFFKGNKLYSMKMRK